MFIDVASDITLQLSVQKQALIEVWCSHRENYRYLPEKTIKVVLPFLSIYLHETRFSPYTSTKTDVTDRMQKAEENPAIF